MVGTDPRVSFQRYKQFACKVNQPASFWVALRTKQTLISSLLMLPNNQIIPKIVHGEMNLNI